MKKIIATVSKEDRKKMEKIFEKKMALENLTKIREENSLLMNEGLYKRFVEDYTNVLKMLNECWGDFADKYQLESVENGYWDIDFTTGNVLLFGSN